VIVINDGSTDQGVSYIKEKFQDDRLVIISQLNQGVTVARNKGAALAKYKHIAFLDGDDTWEPKYLETVSEAIHTFPEAGMICVAGYYAEKEGEIMDIRLAKKYEDQILKINYFENPHVFSHTSATVVSAKAFREVDGFQKGMGQNEDFALFFALALKHEVVYCGTPLSTYFGDVAGQITSATDKDHFFVKGTINRINYSYNLWLETPQPRNKLYVVFIKYEIRHALLTAIRNGDISIINVYQRMLDKEVLALFPELEFDLYRRQGLQKVKMFYIYLSKMLWRMKGFPRVGG
jgi:glycosyltransferase involved in cell wall biosynthesis